MDTISPHKYYSPHDYRASSPPPLVDIASKDITRHDLFVERAPTHTRKYMVGMDVLKWVTEEGTERSQLVINQKAGALVLPFRVIVDSTDEAENGVWFYLQETYRGPHSHDPSESVKSLIEKGLYEKLGVYSLEAPAGGLNHDDSGQPTESPLQAALREATEETGLIFTEDALIDLLPEGLCIGGDINTKITYPFLADITRANLTESARSVEDDEIIGDLLAFRVRSTSELEELLRLTRRCAGTSFALSRSLAIAAIASCFAKNHSL